MIYPSTGGKSWAAAALGLNQTPFIGTIREVEELLTAIWFDEVSDFRRSIPVEVAPSPRKTGISYPTSLIRSPQSQRPGRIARGRLPGQRGKQWAGRKPEFG